MPVQVLQRRTVVSFDVGGTLVTSQHPSFTARAISAARAHGSPVSLVRKLVLTTRPDQQAVRQLAKLCGPGITWSDAPAPCCHVTAMAGAEEMVAAVAEVACPVSLSNVSSVDATHLPAGLDDLLVSAYRSYLIGAAKPDAEAFAAVARGERVALHELIHVGDSWRDDIMGALRAGARCVWLNPQWWGSPTDLIPGKLLVCNRPEHVAEAVHALLKENQLRDLAR